MRFSCGISCCGSRLLFSAAPQVLLQQHIDRLYSIDDWKFGETQFLVRSTINALSCVTVFLACNRSLSVNQLTGLIPEIIGQMTALRYLYVVVFLALFFVSAAHFSCNDDRRDLAVNQLVGPIPSAIGQLTALTALYVVVLSIFSVRCSFLMFDPKESLQQPIGGPDSCNNCAIVKPRA